MEIEEFFTGEHPDGTKFRVRRIDKMWYYAIQIKDDYDGWVWHTVSRNPSKKAIVDRVRVDIVAKQRRIDELKEGGLYNGRNSNDFCVRCHLW